MPTGLWLPANGGFGKFQTNVTAGARGGTVTTASSTAHTKGAWVELISSANEDVYGMSIHVTEVGIAATATALLLDIGAGAAAAERVIIPNLNCWGAGAVAGTASTSKFWYFPIFVAAGERIACRCQAVTVSDTASVAIWLHPGCNGWGMDVPTAYTDLGSVTASSRGTSVTPASGSFGSWTTILDPITEDYNWWHIGYDALADTTIVTGGTALVELGFGDTSAAVTTMGSWEFVCSTGEFISGPVPNIPLFYPLNADTTNGVFARIASFETEARGVNIQAGI